VLDILTSNPQVWEKTALIVSYDENGGFFDHVPPPVPPAGTPGEYVTVPLSGVAESMGIAGPIGLGFRVPCLVISPYTRGGLVSHDVFDHTSQLRLAEARFGVPVPNLSEWRRETVGDMTSAFNFAAAANATKPRLPVSKTGQALLECRVGVDTLLGTFDSTHNPFSYPVPKQNSMPQQESSPVRGTPSGPVSGTAVRTQTVTSAGEPIPVTTGGKPRSRVASTVDAAIAAHRSSD
jgi:phospholipase C